MVGGTSFRRENDSAGDFQRLGPQPLWLNKRCLRTAQDNYVLDRAFALIEGHPSR
jgi:hypothetical protein